MTIKNILILGIGGVGLHIAKRLTHEGHSVTIIETNPELIKSAGENLDAKIVSGSAMEVSSWKAAYAEKMDLLIAVTNNDATNMIAALIAEKFGIRKKITRAKSLDFGHADSILPKDDLKIDLMINPEEVVAQEIVRLVKRTAATDLIDVGEGNMQVLALRVLENSFLVNKTLREISSEFNSFAFRIVAIARGIETIIPHGNHTIFPYDQIFIMVRRQDMQKLMKFTGIQQRNIHHAMILGGGILGKRVAQLLEESVNVTLIEKNPRKAEELASSLNHTQVLHGDGTDANILVLAGLVDMDTFIATTGDNETNIISCLLAKHLMNKQNRDPKGGLGKTIALVDKEDYLVLSSTIGLDIAISAKISAGNEILKFIRRSELLSVAHLHGVDAEVLEFVASSTSLITRKPLRKLSSHFQNNKILIGGTTRNGEWCVGVGDTHVKPGDKVIVVCTSQALNEVRKLFI